MYIVMILKGKSGENADSVEAKPFKDLSKAKTYIEENTDMEKKYWTYCQLAVQGQSINTDPDFF